jgi:hypothetical protein
VYFVDPEGSRNEEQEQRFGGQYQDPAQTTFRGVLVVLCLMVRYIVTGQLSIFFSDQPISESLYT